MASSAVINTPHRVWDPNVKTCEVERRHVRKGWLSLTPAVGELLDTRAGPKVRIKNPGLRVACGISSLWALGIVWRFSNSSCSEKGCCLNGGVVECYDSLPTQRRVHSIPSSRCYQVFEMRALHESGPYSGSDAKSSRPADGFRAVEHAYSSDARCVDSSMTFLTLRVQSTYGEI